MKESVPSLATEPAQTLSNVKALRVLYRAARHISYSTPYAAARLARIADQAEYFLQQWPDELWPTALHSAHPLPARQVLLAWVAAAKRDATTFSLLPDNAWSYGQWHQFSTTLLAALVPFA